MLNNKGLNIHIVSTFLCITLHYEMTECIGRFSLSRYNYKITGYKHVQSINVPKN